MQLRRRSEWVSWASVLLIVGSACQPPTSTVAPPDENGACGGFNEDAAALPKDCVSGSVEYLRRTVDRYHGREFWVYDDTDSAGNHFHVWASFTGPKRDATCPIVIHGDTRDAIPTGSCANATGSDEVLCADWRQYRSAEDGPVTFSLCGSSFDTVLWMYQGCPDTGGTAIAWDDDACGKQSKTGAVVQAGHSYLIRVSGKDGAAGPYVLTIEPSAGAEGSADDAGSSCGVSVEFDSFVSAIYDSGSTAPIHSGATAIQFRLNYSEADQFGGLVMNNGVFSKDGVLASINEGGTLQPNYGEFSDAGVALTGARALKFHARGERGGEIVEFFVGGVGWDGNTQIATYPDSTPAVKRRFTLTPEWREYTIPLSGNDLSHIIGGFGWSANAQGDPDFLRAGSDNALIFYVDNIYFELDEATACRRLQERPRFLQSFTPRPIQGNSDPIVGDFDHRFRGVAFTYDNALALLAFLATGAEADLARARLIGDAFVYAATHDRIFVDGRLRSAYSAGDLTLPPGWVPNNVADEVRLAGFFYPQCQEFQELFADNISTGNTAWVMTALLGLYQRTEEPEYLEAARRLGEFIQQFRDETCADDAGQAIGGFTGGLNHVDELEPMRETFSSAEHNIDVFAAFTLMAELTGEQDWLDGAEHARRFVWSLWDVQEGCFLAGRDAECRINKTVGQLPVDVQAWAVLGIPGTSDRFPGVLQCAIEHHWNQSGGFEGFDFNDDRDGVWFEGTAHVATAYAHMNDLQKAAQLSEELCRAQTDLPGAALRRELPASYHDVVGLVAGSGDGITTGFGFTIHKRLHVAATAWNVFAQARFNPYYQTVQPADER